MTLLREAEPTCALRGGLRKLRLTSPVLVVLAAPDLRSYVLVSVPVQNILDGPFQMLPAFCCPIEGHILCRLSMSILVISAALAFHSDLGPFLVGRICTLACSQS